MYTDGTKGVCLVGQYYSKAPICSVLLLCYYKMVEEGRKTHYLLFPRVCGVLCVLGGQELAPHVGDLHHLELHVAAKRPGWMQIPGNLLFMEKSHY